MLSNLKWGYVIKVKRVNFMLNIIVNTILQNTPLLYFKLISIFIGFRVKWGKPHLTYLPMGFCIFNGRLTLINTKITSQLCFWPCVNVNNILF